MALDQGTTRPGTVLEPHQTLEGKTRPPLLHRVGIDRQAPSVLPIGKPIGGQQHDPARSTTRWLSPQVRTCASNSWRSHRPKTMMTATRDMPTPKHADLTGTVWNINPKAIDFRVDALGGRDGVPPVKPDILTMGRFRLGRESNGGAADTTYETQVQCDEFKRDTVTIVHSSDKSIAKGGLGVGGL